MVKKGLIACVLILITAGCDNLFFGDDPGMEDPLVTYDAFYDEVDRYFSFFPYLTRDFDSAYTVNRVKLEQEPTRHRLIESLGELITVLKDGHTNVFIGKLAISYNGWYDQYPVNRLPDISSYFDSYTNLNSALEYGMLKDLNVGYIRIKTFSGNLSVLNYQAIDAILNDLDQTEGIIIDVRSNGGGNSNNADLIISRFNDEPRLAFRTRRREGLKRTDFGPGGKRLLMSIRESDISNPLLF